MDLFDAIKKRHSYRGVFVDKPIPREDLIRIVGAAIDAPSGCNAQTTSFVVIDDPETLLQMAETIDRPFMRTAKAMIACICDTKPVYKDTAYDREDCAAAVENMLLAITALGYATVWLQGALTGEPGQKIVQILGIPFDKSLRVLLPIGVPATEEKPNTKAPFEKRACFDRYAL